MSVISRLLNTIVENKTDSNDNISKSITFLEAYLKFARCAINRSRKVDRQELIRSYMETLLKTISALQGGKSSSRQTLSGKRKEVFDLSLRHLRDLNMTYESEFKEALDSGLKETYDAVMAPRDDLKRFVQPQKKNASSVGGRPAKQSTKIVLKADFSNFMPRTDRPHKIQLLEILRLS